MLRLLPTSWVILRAVSVGGVGGGGDEDLAAIRKGEYFKTICQT